LPVFVTLMRSKLLTIQDIQGTRGMYLYVLPACPVGRYSFYGSFEHLNPLAFPHHQNFSKLLDIIEV
jgi:hypothetical protein